MAGGAPARGSALGGSAAATSAAGLARISGKITLAPALAARAGTNPVLFVYAKQPNVPGPPLAVRRLRVDHWPVSFDLDDTNSMVPGRSLSGAASVELEARISLSGEALPRPGDLIGHLASVDTHHASNLTVVIDHEFGH
jgi:cytochrome c-type biogenesis protein CcmH